MPTFDGVNLIMTLDSGVTSVDVQSGLYEPWKDWVLSDPQNMGYPQAFISDGGNPLNEIINQGSYFFLNNIAGWRIKPPEEDITVYLTGNLAVTDTSLPAFIKTTGAFTAAILGLQPVTQGVTPVMGQQLEYGSFERGVWLDAVNGIAGTGYNIQGQPIGSSIQPSNNVPDAVAICLARGLPKTIYVLGDFTFDTGDDISGFYVVGQNAARSKLVINAGADTLRCEIQLAEVSGTLDGLSILRDCDIGNLDYFSGWIYDSQINDTITLGGAAQANIIGCVSGEPGTATPSIDMGGSGQSLALRNYVGGIKIYNKTGPEPVSIDLSGGQVKIDLTTVNNGDFVVRGDGKVINAANDDWLPHGTYGSLNLINETSYGLLLQELWTLAGLDPDVPMTVTPTRRLSGAIDLVITGDGLTTTTVTRQ